MNIKRLSSNVFYYDYSFFFGFWQAIYRGYRIRKIYSTVKACIASHDMNDEDENISEYDYNEQIDEFLDEDYDLIKDWKPAPTPRLPIRFV